MIQGKYTNVGQAPLDAINCPISARQILASLEEDFNYLSENGDINLRLKVDKL